MALSRASSFGDVEELGSQAGSNSGGSLVNMDEVYERALAEIDKKLRKPANRQKILTVLELVRHEDLSGQQKRKMPATLAGGDEDPIAKRPVFSSSYIKLSHLAKDYIANIISSQTAFTVQELMALEKTSRGSLEIMLWMGTGFTGTTKWTKGAKDPMVLKDVLLHAHTEMGSPWSSFELLRPRQNMCLVDWQQHGWFTLLPADSARKSLVKHRQLPTPVPLGFELDASAGPIQIIDNHLEFQAGLKVGNLPVVFASLWNEKGKEFPSQASTERFARITMAFTNSVSVPGPASLASGSGTSRAVPLAPGSSPASSSGSTPVGQGLGLMAAPAAPVMGPPAAVPPQNLMPAFAAAAVMNPGNGGQQQGDQAAEEENNDAE